MVEKKTQKIKKGKKADERKKFDALTDAIDYLKANSKERKRNFVETFDVVINLGIDTKANQNVRGSVVLPAGSGKSVRVIVFTDNEKLQKEASGAGADIVGLNDMISKISEGFLDFDYCIATPEAMKSLSKVAKILGPKGLMPNPKNDNITTDIKRAVKEAKSGKINFKNEKCGIVQLIAGKVNFPTQDLKSNIESILSAVKGAKPDGVKGKYIKSLFLSTTMGSSVEVSVDSL